MAVANLFRGTYATLGALELYLLSIVEELDETHPIIGCFARKGLIANFDERAAVETMSRASCMGGDTVSLTICPTMACNFDCPYCFERHDGTSMTPDVQDDVVALAERMAKAFRAKIMQVTWYGGEPLLEPGIIARLSERLMRVADDHGAAYQAEIITNGYLLSSKVVALLERAGVRKAQVTLDGLGDAHDATRHLAGGGPSFDRIVENLVRPYLPFSVTVRQNVHEGNRAQVGPLRDLVNDLRRTSGNDLRYSASPVQHNLRTRQRGGPMRPLAVDHLDELNIAAKAAAHFGPARGRHCGAHTLRSVAIDERGRLHKCWETVDTPEHSFGHARDWDPANPLATASQPDRLTCFLNTTGPVPDDECATCIWLPRCAGGCPYQRLFGTGKRCVAYRDEPTAFVLALAAQRGDATL